MRRLIKKITMFMLAGGFFMGIPGEVRAEKKVSPELSEKYGCSCYDCGTSTEDGALQVKTNSSSLKQGDIVEIEVWYNADTAKMWDILGFYMDVSWDGTILKYAEIEILDDELIKYSPHLSGGEPDSDEPEMILDIMYGIKPLDKNARVATIKYEVLKETDSTSIYFDSISILSDHLGTLDYYGKDWMDVLTLPIVHTGQNDSRLMLSGNPIQGNKEITVPINIQINDGFNLLGLTIDYDASLFTYESLEIDDALKSKISLDSIYEVPGMGQIKASFIALEDIADTGNFLRLKLKAKDGVTAGTTSDVNVSITQVGNKAETKMSGTGMNCTVKLTGSGETGDTETPVPGDVNNDKNIDLVDAVYILQNYNEVREFTSAQEIAADVSGDGTVNLIDALMIMKYFNGEITSF